MKNSIIINKQEYEVIINLGKLKTLEKVLGKTIGKILEEVSLTELEIMFGVFVNTGKPNGSTELIALYEAALNEYNIQGLFTVFLENMQVQTPFLFLKS